MDGVIRLKNRLIPDVFSFILLKIYSTSQQKYNVTHQVSDYILLTLIWEFHHVAYRACQFCQICSCPRRIRRTSELSNQSEQNVVADMTGHPLVFSSRF